MTSRTNQSNTDTWDYKMRAIGPSRTPYSDEMAAKWIIKWIIFRMDHKMDHIPMMWVATRAANNEYTIDGNAADVHHSKDRKIQQYYDILTGKLPKLWFLLKQILKWAKMEPDEVERLRVEKVTRLKNEKAAKDVRKKGLKAAGQLLIQWNAHKKLCVPHTKK